MTTLCPERELLPEYLPQIVFICRDAGDNFVVHSVVLPGFEGLPPPNAVQGEGLRAEPFASITDTYSSPPPLGGPHLPAGRRRLRHCRHTE